MSSRIPLSVLLAGLVLATTGEGARAEGQDQRLSIRPSVRLSLVGDDNVLASRSDPQSDFATWLEPRIAVEYQRPRIGLGADVGADLRYSLNQSQLREVLYDLRFWAEWQPLRDLTLRVTESYVPQPVRLSRPSDDLANLSQSNIVTAEARYRRESRRGRALEIGVNSTWFTTKGFPAYLDLENDGVPDELSDLHSDYLDAGLFVETEQPLGRRSFVYMRGEARERSFRQLPRSDFTELSGLVGLRTQRRRLEADVALGWGRANYADFPTNSRMIGRAQVDYAMPRGWELTGLFVQHFTAEASGADFDETTARLGISKQMDGRTRASLGLLWTGYRADSPQTDRTWIASIDMRLDRQLTRRIKAGLAYRHWRNAGKHTDDDFEQNRVIFELNYAY